MCMTGMVSSDPSTGCSLVSACSSTSCDSTAVCETGLDGQPRCECDPGRIGDGRRCYGNLMERVVELDRAGPQKRKLSGTILLFERGCQLALAQQGPFTLFVPLLKTALSGVSEDYVCKSHLVFGQHLYSELETQGDFHTHHGTARCKGNKQFILLDEPSKVYSVIQEDIPAANGIIHIIDEPITKTLPTSLRDEQYRDKTIGEILAMDEKYNRFLSLSDNCGAPMPLKGPGPLTVFVPTNQAVDRSRDGSIIYMLSDAKHKLQALLKHHMFSQAALTVTELASMTQIQTMANQIIRINLTADGKILLGDKGAALETTNIIASNGIIHMVDGLLFPPSILPILPHRCDVIESKITVGQCVRCSYLYETQCPEGTTELQSHMKDCQYNIPVPSKGCAKYCNSTQQRAECCKGFYGAECKPCIGGFQEPCYGKGTCFDGIHGNGSCACQSAFKGMACHICSDPSKHGENCDEECRCLHGVCDNRPGSQGVCRRGSCLEGLSGDYCDKRATPCNSDGLSEHCHIHAFCSYSGLHSTCVCNVGYEGDGHYCVPVNPCLQSTRGGCDTNAECVYLGPGNTSCVCNQGWSGDGVVCSEIDNCQLESRGGCSNNANCKSLGPAQSECVCQSGYTGDGIVCVLINPCQKKNGGCHALRDIGGDSLDLSGNITALVPSRSALRNLNQSEKNFWLGRYKLPHILK
ncbi:stabilin-1-like [Aplochiton taeniatus]